MSHVLDELELFALGALDDSAQGRIAAHLNTCASCDAEAAELERVVAALQETLPAREPPAALRDRVLSTARAERRAAAPIRQIVERRRVLVPAAVLAAALIAVVGATLWTVRDLGAARDELARSRVIAERVSHGGRTWYMSGVEQWRGAGGMLYVPPEKPAYVVFHDLPPAPEGQTYTIWLIDAEGRWVRGANFRPGSGSVSLADIGVPVTGFDQCAVTLESRAEGRHEGPVVMRSRLYPVQ